MFSDSLIPEIALMYLYFGVAIGFATRVYLTVQEPVKCIETKTKKNTLDQSLGCFLCVGNLPIRDVVTDVIVSAGCEN